MRSRQVFFATSMLVASMVVFEQAFALEAVTAPNSQNSDRNTYRHLAQTRADQMAKAIQLQSQLNLLLACNTQGRFYAPGEAGADSNGCIPFTAQ